MDLESIRSNCYHEHPDAGKIKFSVIGWLDLTLNIFYMEDQLNKTQGKSSEDKNMKFYVCIFCIIV